MKYALQLHVVREDIAADLWGTLRKIRAMGYEGVEFAGNLTRTAQEVKAALGDTGLVCCGWHTPWHYFEPDEFFGMVSYFKVLGIEDAVVPWMAPEKFATMEDCLKIAGEMEAIAVKLADYGMYLGYHNHKQEFPRVETGETPWDIIFENTKRLYMQMDNGNALSAGAGVDIYTPMERFADRVRTVHLKPYSLADGYNTMVNDDNDDVDWARFLAACGKCPDLAWYIVEYRNTEVYTPIEGVDKCLKELQYKTSSKP